MKAPDNSVQTLALRYLACPLCHGRLRDHAGKIQCSNCEFVGKIADGIVLMKEFVDTSYFDDKHEVMSQGKGDDATWKIFYEQQVLRVEERIKPGSVVLDVGCGPTVPYKRVVDFLLIGVDPSYESIRSNTSVDIPVYGSSDALALPGRSVDLIICFYSIHHMTGETLVENLLRVSNAFREFYRVIKPGGSIMAFDLSPWWPGAVLGNAIWNRARRTMGKKLDMYFWRAGAIGQLSRLFFQGATLSIETFRQSPLATFPPIFSLPALKIPRLLYPFDVNLYRWDFPTDVR